MYSDLKGKTAVITGAGKKNGIGYAIAEKLAASGANVVLTDLVESEIGDNPPKTGNRDEMKALARGLAETHAIEARALNVDVTDSATVEHMAKMVKENFETVDILCNNAGSVFGVPSAVHTYEEEAWMKTIDVNLHGVLRVSKAIIPMMMGNGGSIINSASQAGKKPPLFNGAYAAAKAGVIMMTKVMAWELADAGIRVNAICPGIIKTGFTDWRFELEARFLDSTPEKRQAEKCKDIPLGRIGTSAEVANLVAFLASSESSYITGQALNITGGQLMEV